MKLTKQWLKKKNACINGIEAFCNQKETDSIKILKLLIRSNEKEKLQWANWLIARLFRNKKQKISYVIYAARLVLKHYEEKYPNDLRPRKAIEAAEKYLKRQSKENKNAATDAASAASSAASAAYVAVNAANAAAYSAAYSAYAIYAANSAAYAAYAAYAAGNAAYAAGNAAADAAGNATSSATYAAYAAYADNAAYNKIMIKILKYGITLLK